MKKLLLLIPLCLLSTSSVARVTMEDVNRDMAWFAAQNPTVPQSVIDKQWDLYNQPPQEDGSSGELEARTATNGYVILNKSQGLIKQWGRISLPGNSLGQHRVSFAKRMSSVFAITVSSSDPYTSSSCRGCTIETGARVKSYNNSGFDITNGFVGDSKGGVFAVTLYWEATGKL